MTEHLDLDALADTLAGEGAGYDAHLSRCDACSDRLAELAVAEISVTAALVSLPPPSMPAELVERITAALAAEQPAASVPGTVIPLAGRQPRGLRRWLPSVAAGVVLMCGAGLGYVLLSDRNGTVSDKTAALGSAAPAAGLGRNDSGVDYSDAPAVAGALADVLAGRAGTVERAAPRAADGSDSLPDAPPTQGQATGQATRGPQAMTLADPLARLRDPAGLASCLLALLPPDEPDLRPLALDYARYAGAPALAVLLPDPDPTKVAVYVVAPDCSQANDNTLFFTRLDRP